MNYDKLELQNKFVRFSPAVWRLSEQHTIFYLEMYAALKQFYNYD